MEPSAELIGLLHQIRNAASPLHRLKLAALAWRTLRGLSPVDRMAVAKTIGIEGAERVVDQLGHRSGVSPSVLLGAIQRAEEADPEELQRLFEGVADPDRREEILEEASEEFADWIEDEVFADHEPPTPEPEAAADWTAGGAGETEGVDKEPGPDEAGSGLEEREEAKHEPTATGVPPPVPVPTPPGRPPPVRPTTRRAPTTRPPAPASWDSQRRPPRRPADSAPARTARRQRSATSRPDAPLLLVDLDAAASLFERLRILARRAAELSALAPRDVTAVAEMFPAGWARRRAIEALIRGGAVTDPEQLDDVLGPEDDTSRMWALTALAARADVDPGELARLVDDPLLRRRLAVRARRRSEA